MIKALFIQILFAASPVHLSMTTIEHVPGTDSLIIMVKLNYDLFLRDYQTIDDDRDLDILYSYKPFPPDFVNNYINLKVYISVNNKLLKGKLLTMNQEGRDLKLKFLYRAEKKPRKIGVTNTILTRLYSDQVNLTIIRVNDFEKGLRLTAEKSEETVAIK